MEIQAVNEHNRLKVKSFLKRLPTGEDISDEVIDNSMLIMKEEEIKGIISYEQFDKYALIRYFIFQKDLSSEELESLFQATKIKMINNKIEKVLSFVAHVSMEKVFASLGFEKTNKAIVYLDEIPLLETDFNMSEVMVNCL